MEVVLHPDYVIYRDNYCMGLKLTFSQYCIQINDSTACEKEGTINIEWAVEDLIDIKSQSFQSVSHKVLLEIFFLQYLFSCTVVHVLMCILFRLEWF